MKFNQTLITKRALSLLAALASPSAVLAHTGHTSNGSVHSLLHAEHIIVLVAAASIALAVLTFRKK